MATVGELLKNARTGKNITLAQVEQATKIRASFLKSLEEGQYQALPSSAYARGFVKNYAEFLDLDADLLLAKLRREFSDHPRGGKFLPQGVHTDLVSGRKIRITGIFLFITVLIAGFSLYLFFQYRGFLGNPQLTVDSPRQNEVVRGMTSLSVSGETEPDATVKINNEYVEVRPDGKFQKNITLFQGTFILVITATNRFGRHTQVSRTIKIE